MSTASSLVDHVEFIAKIDLQTKMPSVFQGRREIARYPEDRRSILSTVPQLNEGWTILLISLNKSYRKTIVIVIAVV